MTKTDKIYLLLIALIILWVVWQSKKNTIPVASDVKSQTKTFASY